MSYNPARLRLTELWESISRNNSHPLWTIKDLRRSDLLQYNIRLEVFHLDGPQMDGEHSSPSVLFKPLPQEVLDQHPVKEDHPFREYIPGEPRITATGYPWRKMDYIWEVGDHIGGWVWDFPRSGFPKPPRHEDLPIRANIAHDIGWDDIRMPNPVLLNDAFDLIITGKPDLDLRAGSAWEWMDRDSKNTPKFPHLITTVMLHRVGYHVSISILELSYLITAMKSRATQPQVSEEEQETLYEPGLRGLLKYPPAYQHEVRFPILMASAVGPQHARMFYACMDNETLVIRQSRIYSFESKDVAVLDLFARWLLSTPVYSEPSKQRCNRKITTGSTRAIYL